MMYKIDFSKQAVRFIRGLQEDIKDRIKRKFEDVKENPFRYLEHYEGDNFYKLRIGDYRCLIDIDFKNKILIIRVIDKRGRVYKKN